MPRYANRQSDSAQTRVFAGSIPALGTDAKQQRLGRQLADHLGLEPGMLWVRIPPEPLAQHALVEQRSARLPVTQEIVGSNPIGGAETTWYANRHSGQAQTLVSAGSTPACVTIDMRRLGIGEPQWL